MSALKENFRAIFLKDSAVILIGMVVLFFLIIVFSHWDDLSGSETHFEWLGYEGIIYVWLAGSIIGGLIIEFMTRPLGFLLPGFCRVMRKTVFALGLGLCGLPSLLTLLSGNLDFMGHIRVFFVVLFAELPVFWLGVVMPFGKKISCLLYPGIFAGIFFGQQLFDNHGLVARVMSDYYMIPITVGVVVCRIAWALLGREDLMRTVGRTNWGKIPSAFDKDDRWRYARQKNRQQPVRLGWISSAVDRFFIGRMISCGQQGPARYLWGQLYLVLTPSAWRAQYAGYIFIIVPIIILAFGYMDSGMALPMCFMFLLLLRPSLPAYSHRITIGGRQERFGATVINTAVTAVLMTALIVATALLTIPLSRIIPDFTIGKDLWSLHAVSLRFWYGALAIIPLTHAVLILVPKLWTILCILGLMLTPFLIPSPMILSETEPTGLESVVAAGLIAFNWWVFTLASRMVCTKWSLVR
jgi:hypothetical protein